MQRQTSPADEKYCCSQKANIFHYNNFNCFIPANDTPPVSRKIFCIPTSFCKTQKPRLPAKDELESSMSDEQPKNERVSNVRRASDTALRYETPYSIIRARLPDNAEIRLHSEYDWDSPSGSGVVVERPAIFCTRSSLEPPTFRVPASSCCAGVYRSISLGNQKTPRFDYQSPISGQKSSLEMAPDQRRPLFYEMNGYKMVSGDGSFADFETPGSNCAEYVNIQANRNDKSSALAKAQRIGSEYKTLAFKRVN